MTAQHPEKRPVVAVLYGGVSTEHHVSCVSAGAVMSHLARRHVVVPVGITRTGRWTVGEADPERLRIVDGVLPEVPADGEELRPGVNPERPGELLRADGRPHAVVDVVFPVLHGPMGEDGTVQGLLELSGVPYVGTGVLSSAAAMDKEYTKKLLRAEGLAVADGIVLHRGEESGREAIRRLGLPLFVKPARGGSSIGISKVDDPAGLADALDEALRHDSKALVEAELRGPEVEVGVIERADGRLLASPPAQLDGTGDSDEGFYGFHTKYLGDVVHPRIPAPLPDDVLAEVRDQALRAFRALDCRGLARVDFFVTPDGPVVNEINTMPGFTPISMFPQVFRAAGIGYEDLLAELVASARARRG